jgi:hypothetical protein
MSNGMRPEGGDAEAWPLAFIHSGSRVRVKFYFGIFVRIYKLE